VPAGSIFSSHDTLFTSGSLGRYCSTILSLPEAAEEADVRRASERVAAQHPILLVLLPKIVVVLFVLLTALAYLTWFERKVVAHYSGALGTISRGPHGLLQPLADGLKFLFKEDITPTVADKFAYFLAPFLALSLALTSIAVIHFGPKESRSRAVHAAGHHEFEYRPADPVRDYFDGRFTEWRCRMGLQQQIPAARRTAHPRYMVSY